jgi:deoxyribodipyrimidine photo-lyase
MVHLFLFFRDYRIKDNIGLYKTMKHNEKTIIPIFIFVDDQINPNKNDYFSNHSLQFLCESLNDLNNQFKKYNSELYVFKSPTLLNVLNEINKNISIESISFNMDYTPYSIKRTENIQKWCNSHNIQCDIYEDYLLNNIGTFNKQKDIPYTVYGRFKTNIFKNIHNVIKPKNIYINNLHKCPKLKKIKYYFTYSDFKKLYIENNENVVFGGRECALYHLKKVNSNYKQYRNELSYSTTHLSSFIKYGCLSIREVFWYFYNKNFTELCEQIIWREFYFYIAFYYPDVLKHSKNFRTNFNNIKWKNSKQHFSSWCEGKTGFPIVDACMIELNTTGYMHNRGRLITSNFLNRMLGMDWRKGEKYFANKLIDYDPCVNNGNWQWTASTGVDTKPYKQRIFNPWLQSAKYDKDCIYIKKWLPQLKHIPNKELHNWEKYFHKYNLNELNYIKPIISYEQGKQNSIKQYEQS